MALDVYVGSFAKSTNTGVPVDQAVTGVGFTPKAIILFTVGKATANSFGAHHFAAIGFTAGATDSGSCASSSQDGVSTTVTSQRTAEKALTIIQYGETLLAECDLKTFDAGGFTVTWTTNDANAYLIGFIALGGATLTNATVLEFSGTLAGDRAFTGAGFQADMAFVTNGAVTAATPSTIAFADMNFGACSARGGQAAVGFRSQDNTTSEFQRSTFANGECWIGENANGSTFFQRGSVASFDSDGITFNLDLALSNLKGYVLLLKGGYWNVEVRTKPIGAATAIQHISADVAPRLLMMVSAMRAKGSHEVLVPAYFGLGASDGTNAACMTLTDDRPSNPAIVQSVFRSDALFVKAANNTATQDAVAGVPTFDGASAEVPWTTNDAVAIQQLVILAGDTLTDEGALSGSGGEVAHVFVG